uniref:eukaryotic translation initiation factor 5A-1-like n=1 Tax=Erigeron canadensis TaxID=72917 RepID=UPI001CB9043F|nr:eukaryotic translation initiation factor 5A-1-like [Erigeron canadensis]
MHDRCYFCFVGSSCQITEYQVTGIREDGSLALVNEYGEARADLKLPTDGLVRLIKHAFSMNNRLAVNVISAMGEERICGARYYRII